MSEIPKYETIPYADCLAASTLADKFLPDAAQDTAIRGYAWGNKQSSIIVVRGVDHQDSEFLSTTTIEPTDETATQIRKISRQLFLADGRFVVHRVIGSLEEVEEDTKHFSSELGKAELELGMMRPDEEDWGVFVGQLREGLLHRRREQFKYFPWLRALWRR